MGLPGTAENYVKGVQKFVAFLGYADPETALSKLQSGELNAGRKVDEYIDFALKKYAHKTVRNQLFGIKKWLQLNNVKVNWESIEFPTSVEVKEADKAPSKDEIKLLLQHAKRTRDRAVILLSISSGLRLGTLLSLTINDVNMNYSDVALIKVEKKPGRKFMSRAGLSSGRFYFTFITPEAKQVLLQYFRERQSAGEKLTGQSPLIGDAYNRGKFITVEDFERVWHRLLKRAGLAEKSNRWYLLHVHTLRKFFRSNCVGVNPSYREFWMGHKGGYLDESYFRAEEQLHLNEYKKAIPYLTIYSITETPGFQIDALRMTILQDVLRGFGATKEELKRLTEKYERAKNVDAVINEFKRLIEDKKSLPNGDGPRYFIANHDGELVKKLKEGWKLVRALNRGKYLLQQD
jgi:integrase